MAVPAADAGANIADALAQHERIKRSTDLPLFYGRPDKDTISARLLVDRITKAAVIGAWDDARKCAEFYMVLRDKALLWYDSLEHRDVAVNDYDALTTAFVETYEAKFTAKTTCANFSDLSQKQGETVNDFYNRVHAVVKKLGQMRPAVLNAVRVAHPGAAVAIATAIKTEGTTDERKYWQQLLFTAGLRDDIRMKVMDDNKETLAECFKSACEHETLLNERRKAQNVSAINSDHQALQDVPQATVDAWDDLTLTNVNNVRYQYGRTPFRRSSAQGPYRRPPQGPPGPRQYNYGSQSASSGGRMSNAAARNVACHFCHKMGHFQRDCRSRIAAGAPMVSQPGARKINAVNETAAPSSADSVIATLQTLNW